jgi:hypothetical protein
MINPSASGWVDKYFTTPQLLDKLSCKTADGYYLSVRSSGFIYGHVVTIHSQPIDANLKWTLDEMTKLSLLEALYGLYVLETGKVDRIDFITQVINFYQSLRESGFNVLKHVFTQKPSALLEEIIDERVATNHDMVSKNFSHIITNALLFIDVLAFQRFLKKIATAEKFIERMESTIMNLISLTLKTKVSKTAQDDLLLKVFEASLRYVKPSSNSVKTVDDIKLDFFTFPLEKYYLLDVTTMVLWRDTIIENDEVYFLQKIAEILVVDQKFALGAISDTNNFLREHYNEIPYFHYSNPVKHFYDNLSQSLMVLLTRNKKRLIKEISQSKELMVLLAKSTQRNLDPKEKKQIKQQILEICKTIPSLTIFLLPGGSLMLPLLIKFIPQLLPTAFNENLEE